MSSANALAYLVKGDGYNPKISPCCSVGKENWPLALHTMDRRRAQRFYRPFTGLNEGELNAEDGWDAGIRNRVPLNEDEPSMR